LALVAGVVAICVVVTIRFSPERRGGVMTVVDPVPVPTPALAPA
jgi:MFS transporter, SHS family, lactate transporter